jgi:hypothetical protein
MISFQHARFRYEPYPIGAAPGFVAPDVYEQFLDTWPSHSQFKFMAGHGNRYSLSELNNPESYHEFIAAHEVWREFHRTIKSEEFIGSVLAMLREHNIDLGINHWRVAPGAANWRSDWKERARETIGEFRTSAARPARLNARFEFAMKPAQGGCIVPHTDMPSKIITLVVSVVRPGEWNSDFGGATEVVRPKDPTQNYNYLNRYLSFEEVETLSEFAFEPNQCVIFVKTFNSWHTVRPMHASSGDLMRKTLTINIERWE